MNCYKSYKHLVADNNCISLLTSSAFFALGVTGVGLAVPGATAGTGVSGVPDGSAVGVPGGTGVPGKPGKA